MDSQKISNIIGLILMIIVSFYAYAHSNNEINNTSNMLESLPDISEEKINSNYCENLIFQPNNEQLLKDNNCDVEKISNKILDIKR